MKEWTSLEWNHSKYMFSVYWGDTPWLSPSGVKESIDQLCSFIENIIDQYPYPRRIADVGCGKMGILGKEVLKRNITNEVDFFEYVNIETNGLCGSNVIIGDFNETLKNYKEYYNASVCLNSVFVDSFDLNSSVEMVSQSLKDDGFIIATSPSGDVSKSVFPRYCDTDPSSGYQYLEFNKNNSMIDEIVGIPRWRQWTLGEEQLVGLMTGYGFECNKLGSLAFDIKGIPKLVDILHPDDKATYMKNFNNIKKLYEENGYKELPKIDCWLFTKESY